MNKTHGHNHDRTKQAPVEPEELRVTDRRRIRLDGNDEGTETAAADTPVIALRFKMTVRVDFLFLEK